MTRTETGTTKTTTRLALALGAAALLAMSSAGCAADPYAAAGDEPTGESQDEIRVVSSFTSRGTGYYPHSSALEGGFKDRIGKKLRTLQQFLAGDAEYVSVAMDTNAFKYGTRLRIKELEAKYGRAIVFRVVDTGGAFRGKGRSRIDVCTANRAASMDATINGVLHIDVIDERSAPPTTADPPADNDDATDDDAAPASGSGSGRACTNDGTCNPGNDGSGEICVSGRCVSGCRTNAQCPGSTTCRAGQCR